MTKKPKLLLAVAASVAVVVSLALALHTGYRAYVNHRFSTEMDHAFGEQGWGIIGSGADHQYGEQINLYRTLYIRFIHPTFKKCTPWRDLRFTHKTSCIHRPWHYWINIVTKEREITYYWSIRENKWMNVWDNYIKHYWKEKREEYAWQLANVQRRGRMNFAKTIEHHPEPYR